MSKKPVPSKKQARTSTRRRWATYVAKKRKHIANWLQMVPSEAGEGKYRLSHRVDPHTGTYRGRQVVKPKDDTLQAIEA